MPLSVLLRNRLKYALTYKEVKMICMQRLVKVDPTPATHFILTSLKAGGTGYQCNRLGPKEPLRHFVDFCCGNTVA